MDRALPGRVWYVVFGDIAAAVLQGVLRREAYLRRQPPRRNDGVPQPVFHDHAEHLLWHNV